MRWVLSYQDDSFLHMSTAGCRGDRGVGSLDCGLLLPIAVCRDVLMAAGVLSYQHDCGGSIFKMSEAGCRGDWGVDGPEGGLLVLLG